MEELRFTIKKFEEWALHCCRTDFPYMGTIKGAMIGPLLTTDPEEKTAMTAFGGTYQEYIGTRGYKRPDLIAAFNPGRQFNSTKLFGQLFSLFLTDYLGSFWTLFWGNFAGL